MYSSSSESDCSRRRTVQKDVENSRGALRSIDDEKQSGGSDVTSTSFQNLTVMLGARTERETKRSSQLECSRRK
jgi:hypothetical protein